MHKLGQSLKLELSPKTDLMIITLSPYQNLSNAQLQFLSKYLEFIKDMCHMAITRYEGNVQDTGRLVFFLLKPMTWKYPVLLGNWLEIISSLLIYG